MEVVVFGKHVDVSNGLREHTEEKVARVAKYARDVRRVEVDYSEIPNPRVSEAKTCEILVHMKGNLVKGHAEAVDHHAALDLALGKVERQMRRLHDRRTKRPASRRDGGQGRAALNNESGPSDTSDRSRPAPDEDAGGETDGEPAVVVKVKQFSVKPMTTDEAALQMDLLGHDFFLFTLAQSGRPAVLYRRRDGNLGLIESA